MNKIEEKLSRELDFFGMEIISIYEPMVMKHLPPYFPDYWASVGWKDHVNEVLEEMPPLKLRGCDASELYSYLDMKASERAFQLIEDKLLESVCYI